MIEFTRDDGYHAIMSAPQNNRHEGGNVLFLILIAVALFAALSYVVTSSTRSGSPQFTEKDRLAAAEIFNYIVSVRTAVTRMIMGGVPIETLSAKADGRLKVDGTPETAVDNYLCTQDSCRVFSPLGGGVIYRSFLKYAMPAPASWDGSWLGTGETEIRVVNIEGIGTALNDVVLRILLIQPQICEAFSQQYLNRSVFDWSVEANANLGHLFDLEEASVYHYSGPAAKKDIIPIGDQAGCMIYATLIER